MSKVLLNFSPYFKRDGKDVYQLHIEDISDPDVYARFNIIMPEAEVTESGRMDISLQEKILDCVRANIQVFNNAVSDYQFADVTLEQFEELLA